MKLKHQLNSYR